MRSIAPPRSNGTRILSIQNRQRARAVDLPLLRVITQSILQDHLAVPSHELGLHLIGATEMARLNQAFLQHKGSTDVITFDHSDPPRTMPPAHGSAGHLHGEIFISVPDTVTQAKEFGTTWQGELIRYVIHGLLHLMGHDDLQPDARRAMKRAENRLVAAIAKAQPVTRLQRSPASSRRRRIRTRP